MSDEDASKGIIKYQATDGSEVKLSPSIIQKYVVTGNAQADDKDVFRFMAQCSARRLNPLAGDAYMTTFKNKDGGTTSSVIVSKDYFVRTATKRDSFDGLKAGVVVANKHTGELSYREGTIVGMASETLVGGWADVFDKNRRVPSHAEVSVKEYDTGRSLWKSKPATMIRKVALVQALREAYPGEFGGLYDSAEMPEATTRAPEPDVEAIEAQVVEDEATGDAEAEVEALEAVAADGEESEVF